MKLNDVTYDYKFTNKIYHNNFTIEKFQSPLNGIKAH